MKKSTLVLIILLSIFFTSTLVLIYLNYLKPSVTIPVSDTVSASTSTPTAIPALDPTADWKTYTDPTYGFSFKYPENKYTLDNPPKFDCPQPIDDTTTSRCVLSVIKSCSSFECLDLMSLILYLDKNDNNYLSSLTDFTGSFDTSQIVETTLGGIPAKKRIYIDDSQMLSGPIYYFDDTKHGFIIYGNPNDLQFNQLISTFEFTSLGGLPFDLVNLVKSKASSGHINGSADVIIGQSKIVGNFASVAFNYATGGGGIFWAVKVNGTWEIVTGGQEPPKCSLLLKYSFPKEFSCTE